MIDQKRCPLCGKFNMCARAEGGKSCWCFAEKIPQALLDKVPEELRMKVCICQACVKGYQELEGEDLHRGRGED